MGKKIPKTGSLQKKSKEGSLAIPVVDETNRNLKRPPWMLFRSQV
jgi:hypothetical protein